MRTRAVRRKLLNQVTTAIAALQALGLTFDESIKLIERGLKIVDKRQEVKK